MLRSSSVKFAINPTSIITNPDFLERFRAGQLHAIARAITVLESSAPRHMEEAKEFMRVLGTWSDSGRARRHTIRIGFTGPPGAGKSCVIDKLGIHLLEQGFSKKLAVLTIDPSSLSVGGSILGDKTRMEALARRPDAFVRPSPSRGLLGGIGVATAETVDVVEAAGFDTVLIESVGVGQAEVDVASVADVLVFVASPTGGDALQGIKRGLMEAADVIFVNKADPHTPLFDSARQARAQIKAAVNLLAHGAIPPRRHVDWKVPVGLGSAAESCGIDSLWGDIQSFLDGQMAASPPIQGGQTLSSVFGQSDVLQRGRVQEDVGQFLADANLKDWVRVSQRSQHYWRALDHAISRFIRTNDRFRNATQEQWLGILTAHIPTRVAVATSMEECTLSSKPL